MDRVVVVSCVLALAGCASKPAEPDDVAAMTALKDEMCGCMHDSCAEIVSSKLAAWSRAKANRPATDDVETMQKMSALNEAYSQCLVRAANSKPPVDSARPAPPSPPPPPAPDLPSVPTGAITADRLWQSARTWARDRRHGRVMAKATFEYVDATGALDPVDGKLILAYGRVDESEAKRRIGAKVRPKQTFDDCFTLTNAGRWDEARSSCVDTSSTNVRCSVEQIWKRAIARSAPAEAVATVEVAFDAGNATWTFTIEDEPRKIHIRHTFADDCELAVER